MAKVTIPDEVLHPYDGYATTQGRPVDAVVTDQLRRFSKLVPGERAVVISLKQLKELEPVLGGSPIIDGAALIETIRRRASLTIGGVTIPFTTGQMRELELRAERQGRPVQELVEDTANKIAATLFWGESVANA